METACVSKGNGNTILWCFFFQRLDFFLTNYVRTFSTQKLTCSSSSSGAGFPCTCCCCNSSSSNNGDNNIILDSIFLLLLRAPFRNWTPRIMYVCGGFSPLCGRAQQAHRGLFSEWHTYTPSSSSSSSSSVHVHTRRGGGGTQTQKT